MILLVSHSLDTSTDYIVAQLRNRNATYLRLDSDLVVQDRVSLDPVAGCLVLDGEYGQVTIARDHLRSVLYRAPTHLRESSGHRHSPDALLRKHQWTALLRSLMVFDRAKWINHPAHTFQAENKPYQLAMAAREGFDVPPTRITNAVEAAAHVAGNPHTVVKALDSFLLRMEGKDAFFYSQFVTKTELQVAQLREMPVIVQTAIADKVDIRVTVVGDECFAAEISSNGRPIEGDWRLQRTGAAFTPIDLPASTRQRCVGITRRCGLVFAAIDLVASRNQYYFLELNPTGEWGWLIGLAGFDIDRAIANELCVE